MESENGKLRPIRPYDLEDRIEEVVLETMDKYGECPVGRYRINKRIDKLSKIAFGDKSRVYPTPQSDGGFNYCFLRSDRIPRS